MSDTLVRWVVLIVAVFVALTLFLFALLDLPPGDPLSQAVLGRHAWAHELRAIHHGIPPGQSFGVRYAKWMWRVLGWTYFRILAPAERRLNAP